jgi:hypothetical protein
MGQFRFFDADRRLAAITAKGDPLEMIARVVPFGSFRAEIEATVLTPVSEKKSTAGRKPIDVIVMFRMLVLQSLYNLSDEQVEYQVRDRLSFTPARLVFIDETSANTGGFVRRKIVDNDDVVPLEGRRETALDVGHESLSVHCPVDDTRRGHAILAQSGNKGDRLPMTLWLNIQQRSPRAQRP